MGFSLPPDAPPSALLILYIILQHGGKATEETINRECNEYCLHHELTTEAIEAWAKEHQFENDIGFAACKSLKYLSS